MPIGPLRDAEVANAMLVEASSECRDFAVIVGRTFGRTPPDLDRLGADLSASLDRWLVGVADDSPMA
jgi:hypothetical protein